MKELVEKQQKMWKMLHWYFTEKALPKNRSVYGRKICRNHLKFIKERINPTLEKNIEPLLHKIA